MQLLTILSLLPASPRPLDFQLFVWECENNEKYGLLTACRNIGKKSIMLMYLETLSLKQLKFAAFTPDIHFVIYITLLNLRGVPTLV